MNLTVNHGQTNGHAVASAAGPSKAHSLYTPAPTSPADSSPGTPPSFTNGENGYHSVHDARVAHNDKILNHAYDVGFQSGNYSDVTVHVLNLAYRLHSIFLSRSPYLAHLMSTSASPNLIYIPIEHEPHITPEALAIALGWLYSYNAIKSVEPRNARAVLAAGCLLGGMDDLCAHAYALCKASLSLDTIDDWLQFLQSLPHPSDGTHSPALPATVFGPYAKLFYDDILNYLVATLPQSLDTEVTGLTNGHLQSAAGLDTLLHVYSRVPFDLFKQAIESPAFAIGTDQQRFRFAKSAIALRKEGIARDSEEAVVLAFGAATDNGSSVHVTRKIKSKKRPLWKVTK